MDPSTTSPPFSKILIGPNGFSPADKLRLWSLIRVSLHGEHLETMVARKCWDSPAEPAMTASSSETVTLAETHAVSFSERLDFLLIPLIHCTGSGLLSWREKKCKPLWSAISFLPSPLHDYSDLVKETEVAELLSGCRNPSDIIARGSLARDMEITPGSCNFVLQDDHSPPLFASLPGKSNRIIVPCFRCLIVATLNLLLNSSIREIGSSLVKPPRKFHVTLGTLASWQICLLSNQIS